MNKDPNTPEYRLCHGYLRGNSGRGKYQHREIMERYLGRSLTTNETVNHINGVKTDNRLENLEVLTNSDHITKHWKEGRYVNHTYYEVIEGKKLCFLCQNMLPLENFHKNKRLRLGVAYNCKECCHKYKVSRGLV